MPDEEEYPHEITLTGATFEDLNYSFEVDGELVATEDSDGETGTVTDTSAEGRVTGNDTDTYRFSGHLTNIETMGWVDATITHGTTEDSTSDDGTAEEDTGEEDTAPDHPGHHFESETFTIASTDRTPAMEYTFTVDGTAAEGSSMEDADSVTEQDDGTYEVAGTVGPKGSDTYELDGYVTSFDAVEVESGADVHEDRFEVQAGGVALGVWEVLGLDEKPHPGQKFTTQDFSIRSTARTPAMEYTFEVDGTVSEGASLEEADQITERDDGTYEVTGTVGPKGSDTYEVEGYLTSFTAVDASSGDEVESTRFETAVSGEPEELWKLLGLPEPTYSDTGPEAIGGGEHYSQKVTEDDADYVAESLEAARNALDGAQAGEIVFVPGDVEEYSPSKDQRLHVPAGVTFASDRGVDGSDGALFHTDAAYSYGAHGLITAEQDARVTGLRVRGPHPDPDGGWREHSYDYEMSGVEARQKDVEVDNCEIWGFAHSVNGHTTTHCHHNHLHHCNMQGLGYCMSTGDTEGAIFEYNYCQHWRHVVAAGGDGGYEARYNLIDGPGLAHVFDQHAPGGSYTEIHHNTCRVGDDVASGDPFVPFATFRGDNARKARVYKNWAFNTLEPLDSPSEYFTDEFITHPKHGGTGWTDIKWWDNHLGEDEPSSTDIGCPR